MFNFQPIGFVRTRVTEMSRGGWARIESEIHVDEYYREGLRGLDEFSHVIVVFGLHRAEFDPAQHMLRRPRGRPDAPQLGVFAQRTKFRPNPIGVTAVELLAAQGNVLRVRGLDAVDETPVLDLKPYIPMFDRIEQPRVPPWVDAIMDGYF